MSSSKKTSELSRKKASELLEKFESAKTNEESFELFKKMDESGLFPEYLLGFYCWPLALKLHVEGSNDCEKILYYGKRALESFLSKDNSNNTVPCDDSRTHLHHFNYVIAQALNLVGVATFDLNRFTESLRYFKKADKILIGLERKGNNSCPGYCVLRQLENTHLGLFEVKRSMGKKEEAATHTRKVLEIREKRMEEGCIEIGRAYLSVYKAYLAAMDAKEAFPFCLKALETYRKHMGCDPVEVAVIMRDLGFIYSQLGECEKALEHNLLAQRLMKKVTPNSSDLLNVEVLNGDMLHENGRYEESIEVFKGVASHAEVKGIDKAHAFYGMAKASVSLGRFDDAKKYMRTAQRIYEKEEMDPLYAACGFEDMSRLYEKMNDRETAISLVRRVITVPSIPQTLLLDASTRLFMLISLVRKEEEAIPYMEDAVEKLKDSVGSKHYAVGLGNKTLGVAYVVSGQPELALKCLTIAKDIMDVCHGPNHLESLETSHKLAVAYASMKRVEPAIAIEEKVIEGIKGLAPNWQEFLAEAVGLLNNLNAMKELMASPAWPVIIAFENTVKPR